MRPGRIVIFTRYPTEGAAKTRLIPALGPGGAAALHRRLTERTLAVARTVRLPIELRITGAPAEAFRDWLGDVAVADQGEGDLGARLLRAATPYPVIFIGSDLPDLAPRHLLEAEAALERTPAVIGPAEDGGYWLLGLARPIPGVFEAIPWSTEGVFAATMDRLAAAEIEPALLERLADLDRPEDLRRWPDLLA